MSISIHALREEGDYIGLEIKRPFLDFYPRPPRGGRRCIGRLPHRHNHFYPRPPRGGRPVVFKQCGVFQRISIHALREEGDLRQAFQVQKYYISIHALREEGDKTARKTKAINLDFYPRPPRGGRHSIRSHWQCVDRISIHALREEGDDNRMGEKSGHSDFYPRPPRGGRPKTTLVRGHRLRFLSTPSARRATAKTETKSLFSNKLYNILHEFRRALIYNGSKNYPNHAK